MELSPHQIRTATFATSRKGLDPDEVTSFLARVADALETTQNHSTAMEAKARAAVAKLQERAATSDASESSGAVPPGQADEISRTLLLAQRAADEAIAGARGEADRLLETARADAASAMESSRQLRESMAAEARAEATAAGVDERERLRSEVEALRARRDFLSADVEHLEQFLVDQRDRLRVAATTLVDLAERVPGGLGHLRAPLLSADDEPGDAAGAVAISGQSDAAEVTAGDPELDPSPVAATISEAVDAAGEPIDAADGSDRWRVPVDDDGPDTEAVPLVVPLDVEPDDPTPVTDPMQLRFRPDVTGRTDTSHR